MLLWLRNIRFKGGILATKVLRKLPAILVQDKALSIIVCDQALSINIQDQALSIILPADDSLSVP